MLSPAELKKVDIFKDTYNAMYLKDMSQEKLNYIKSISNPVQKQLIDNLNTLTNPNHPYNIKLIEGPTEIRKFELKENQKTIYLFGEIHRYTVGHCKNPNAVPFHHYLQLLAMDSPAFFDFYLETPMVKSKKNSSISSLILFEKSIISMYNNPSISFLQAYKTQDKSSPTTTGYMFKMIRNTLSRCFQPALWPDAEECKLMRFHNVDLRNTWDIDNLEVTRSNLKSYGEDVGLQLLFLIFLHGLKKYNMIDVIRRVNKECPSVLNVLKRLIANNTINILDIFNVNKSFKKELDASYKKKEIERWLIKMADHKIINFKKKMFINIIKTLISSIENNTPFVYPEMHSQLSIIFLNLNVLLLDTYCLSRIFKLHNLKKKKPSGEFQPAESKNIIIYAGNIHSNNMAQFFYSIGFKDVYSYHNPNYSCVNMKTSNNFKFENIFSDQTPSPLRAPSPNCVLTDAQCKKLKKDELVQVALKCKVVENKTKGNSMTKIQLCDLLKKNSPKPTASSNRKPSPNCVLTDAQCKKLKKDELVQVALKCKVVENKTKGSSMTKIQLCSLLKKNSPKPPTASTKPNSPKPTAPKTNLSKLTVIQLRNLAKTMNLKGYSKFNKDDLIHFIQANQK